MMGFFTAVGGGLLRDVCLARVPYIFQRSNLYAIAAIAGALTYIVLVQCLDIWNIAAGRDRRRRHHGRPVGGPSATTS